MINPKFTILTRALLLKVDHALAANLALIRKAAAPPASAEGATAVSQNASVVRSTMLTRRSAKKKNRKNRSKGKKKDRDMKAKEAKSAQAIASADAQVEEDEKGVVQAGDNDDDHTAALKESLDVINEKNAALRDSASKIGRLFGEANSMLDVDLGMLDDVEMPALPGSKGVRARVWWMFEVVGESLGSRWGVVGESARVERCARVCVVDA